MGAAIVEGTSDRTIGHGSGGGLREGLALAEESQRLDDGGIVAVEVFRPSLLVEDIINDAAIDETLQQLVRLLENIKANRYSTVFSYPIRVTLSDQYKPFLYPNQFVNFNKDSLGVAEAQKLAYPCNNDLEVISQIYFYVIENMSYDYDKAAVVKSGYLPDIDQVFTAKKGICLDYAALMASMLRSQNIPTKMEIGYAGNVYHAWLSSYVNGIGWINGMIEFDGVDWSLMDPTFATTMKKRKLQSFISDSDNYSAKYIY